MLEPLNDALSHIEDHLGDRIDMAELARIAMTSEYHLRRMFSALAGIGLSEYVRRRRLTLAGAEVIAGRRTLLDISQSYGYASSEAFARAFRAMQGIGPSEARRTGAVLAAQPRMSFRLTIEGSAAMRYRIVHKDAFAVVGKKARVPLVHEGMNADLMTFIRGIDPSTLQRIAALSDQEPRGIAGVSDGLDVHRGEGTEFDYYHAVMTSAEPPADLDQLSVSAGNWAVFESSGPFPTTLQYLWRDIFTQWFPSQPYRSRPGPEIVLTRLLNEGTEADAELWIPVELESAVR
ncbi:AraC family transcriptional regulator [Streptomyces sp. NPDC005963]|uniref:AraC family transcriptional regulator n=1 Tax=Streptomyces sp. NPDC005963 TaxID=3156721 RepID=UPI0033C2AC0D